MNGLVSYGGDRSVVATRSEIERITSSLAVVQNRLTDELSPLAQLNGLVHHLQLDLHLPETLVRLGLQRHGCFVASESYFTGDARVAHQLQAVADTIHENPWVQKLIPSEVWVGMAAVVGVSAFTNTNVTALGLRTAATQVPTGEIAKTIESLPSHRIAIAERPPSAVTGQPNSLAALAGRLGNNSGNIRIESYQTSQGRVLVMYLPGTAEWNPMSGKKAFDLRSDVELLGNGEKSSSYRAANAALSAFGAKENDRLILVGYSQGGMVAAQLAQSHPNVVGLVTLGSPIANEAVPSTVATISLEHSNDVVPALSGNTNPLTENWATANRHVEIEAGETVLKAHDVTEYVQTAKLADRSTDSGLTRLRSELLGELQNVKPLVVREYEPLKATS